MMMAVPQPGPFAPHALPGMHAGSVAPYSQDPSYPVMPMAMAPASPGMRNPGASGFGDPRYASDPALPVQTRRRHLIIMLASAVIAVLIGIAAVLIVNGRRQAPASPGPASSGSPDRRTDREEARPAHATAQKPVQSNRAPAGEAVPPGTGDPATAAGSAAPPEPAPAAAPAARTGECFADVSSQPAGADIVLDQTVVGTTPQRVPLPCGAPVELLIRKPRLTSVTRTVTPTPEGVPVKVALPRQTFLVKVSSVPEGATITLNGKALGVTPTTVKVPGFESSALNLSKDGYETETEKVAPRTSGSTVHTVLKRLERRKPR
jgi:hypothetical protein